VVFWRTTGVDNELARRSRAIAEFNLQRYAEAVTDLDEAIKFKKKDQDALRLRAVAHVFAGNMKEAQRDCAAAAKSAPSHPDTYAARGYLQLSVGCCTDVAESFRNAFRNSFGKSYRFAEPMALLLAHQFKKAVKRFEDRLTGTTDGDIDDALQDLQFWLHRLGTESDKEVMSTVETMRKRLNASRMSPPKKAMAAHN
jgi:tetratricopeptide (TPR) repeat protein